MSWGERSCRFGGMGDPCPTTPSPLTCDARTCEYYEHKDRAEVDKAVNIVLSDMRRGKWRA